MSGMVFNLVFFEINLTPFALLISEVIDIVVFIVVDITSCFYFFFRCWRGWGTITVAVSGLENELTTAKKKKEKKAKNE